MSMKKNMMGILMAMFVLLTAAGKAPAIENDYIEIQKYKGLNLELVEAAKVTDDDVEEQVSSILSANASKNPITDRTAEEGDWVSIDYICLIDGVGYAQETAADYNIELGKESIMTGFDANIEGHGTGEQFEFDMAFPDDYTKDPEKVGVTAHWIVTLNEIYSVSAQELTEDFVKNVIGIDDVDTPQEYRDYVRKQLEQQNQRDAEAENLQIVYAAVEEQSTVKKYPQDELDKEIEKRKAEYEASAAGAEMDLASYLSTVYSETEEEFDERIQTEAENVLRQKLIFEAIAEKEDLTVSDSEYKKNLDSYAEENGFLDGDELKTMYSEEDIRYGMMQEKVLAFIEKNAKVSNTAASSNDAQSTSGHSFPLWAKILIPIAVVVIVFIMLRSHAAKARTNRRREKK